MQKLNLPEYPLQIKKMAKNKDYVFDILRKKHVVLTPEEWVRQNLLHFLIYERHFPVALFSIETGLKVNRVIKRYDFLVYNRSAQPLMLCECKAPEVKVAQKTFDQVIAYNQSINAGYILVSNGINHFCCKLDRDQHKFIFLQEIPDYEHIV